jgi:hypothetical protein
MYYLCGHKKITMTQQEIQQRNKEIALMLGWEDATLEYKLKWCGVPTEERLDRLNKDYIPFLTKKDKSEPLFNDGLRCDSDWNQLMESVEFIENLKMQVSIIDNECAIIDIEKAEKEENPFMIEPVTKCYNGETKKEAVFIAISDFAKLYNNNNLI